MSNLAPSLVTSPLDRTPPHSLEAERGVIGSIFIDPVVCDDVAAILSGPEAFHAHAHQVLYRHLAAMSDEGTRIDVTLLIERLRKHGDLDAVGGIQRLVEIAQWTPIAANAVYYAGVVRDYSLRRAAIRAAATILRDAHDSSVGAQQLVEAMHASAELLCTGSVKDVITTASQAVAGALERIASLTDASARAVIDTGLTDVDRTIGGLFPGELVILGARPTVGKTSLAMQIAVRHARANKQVLFISTEMADRELMLRAMCSHAGVSANFIRNGTVTDRELSKIEAAGDELAKADLLIVDRSDPSVADIRNIARRQHRQSPLSLLVVDYLQRLRPADAKRPRQEQVSQLVADSKTLARTLGIPVLMVCIVGRESDKASDQKPRLSHLRESGAIEAEADQVWLLHRPELCKPNDPDLRGKAELIVAKNRNGAVGEFALTWDGARTILRDAAPPYRDDAEDDGENLTEDFLKF